MGSNSKPDDIIGESALKEYKDHIYKAFQLREYQVRRSNREFGCPFCSNQEDDHADNHYTRLLQHAIRVAEGSISGKQRAKHSVMARYLAIDLAAELKPAPGQGELLVEVEDDQEWLPNKSRCKTPTRRKRSLSDGTEVNSASPAARTPPRRQVRQPRINENAQKLAMAEKREKEALDKVRELEKKIDEMTEEMKILITKERLSNDELQVVREELLKGFNDIQWADNAIGVLKLGELDPEVFINKCESEIKGVELCSLWQDKIRDPHWYPFRIVTDNEGKSQRLINEDDTILHALKEEWGTQIHDAVVNAVTSLQEINASGCYPVPELWNFGETRKATLDEVIRHIIKLVAEGKGKKQTKPRKSPGPKGR